MKRFKSKFAVIAAASLLLLAIVSAAVWFFFLKEPDSDKPSRVETPDKTGIEAIKPLFEDVVRLEPFESIKLKPGSNISFVTLEVSLELVAPDMRQEVQARMEPIRRIIETTVAQIAWLELRSIEGKLGLKLELLKLINESLSEASLPSPSHSLSEHSLAGDTVSGDVLSGKTPVGQNPALQSQNVAGARIRDLFFINLIMK